MVMNKIHSFINLKLSTKNTPINFNIIFFVNFNVLAKILKLFIKVIDKG